MSTHPCCFPRQALGVGWSPIRSPGCPRQAFERINQEADFVQFKAFVSRVSMGYGVGANAAAKVSGPCGLVACIPALLCGCVV